MVYPNDADRQYEGEWDDDKRHGKGKETFENGDLYIGNYKLGAFDGLGMYKWANGATYIGHFKAGLKVDHGLWKSEIHQDSGTSESYEGHFNQDKFNGLGIYTFKNGKTYKGDWVDGRKQGIAIETDVGGGTYIGDFDENCEQTTTCCQYEFRSGTKYIGGVVKQIKQGFGKIEFANRSEYIGHFKDGKKTGLGQYTQGSAKYQGEYKDDKQHGQGKQTNEEDKSSYEGEYNQGLPHGLGREINSDGKVHEGQFDKGQAVIQDENNDVDGVKTSSIAIEEEPHSQHIQSSIAKSSSSSSNS